jgi:hypothetical protein
MIDQPEHKIRCGDHVKHRPTDEEWVVAYADYQTGKLAWIGWPEGRAEIDDCILIGAASDEQHTKYVDSWRRSPARKDNGGTDHRRAVVLRLYGTDEERSS